MCDFGGGCCRDGGGCCKYWICPFRLKKYNRIFVNLCFRTCVCKFELINIKIVFENFGCAWRERRQTGGVRY